MAALTGRLFSRLCLRNASRICGEQNLNIITTSTCYLCHTASGNFRSVSCTRLKHLIELILYYSSSVACDDSQRSADISASYADDCFFVK